MSSSELPNVEALLADADWVQAIAQRLVSDASLAQDVVQETWLAALARGPRSGAHLRGWLGAVARNAARKMRRGELRRDAREEFVARAEAQPSTYEVVERFAIQHEVASALLELEEPLRRTLLLRFYEELTLAQVAARTGVALTTVEGRVERGLDALRRKLDRQRGGDGRAWALAVARLLPRAQRGAMPVLPHALLGSFVARIALVLAVVGVPWFVAHTSSPTVRTSSALREVAVTQSAPVDTLRRADDPQRAARIDVGRDAAEVAATEINEQHAALGALDVRLATSGGEGLADVRIELWPQVAAAYGPLRHVQRTDAGGHARFEQLASGSYRVEHALDTPTRVGVAGDERTRVELRVPSGAAVRGIVVDAAGAPVADAAVWLSASASETWVGGRSVASTVALEPIARTDADGRFELANVGAARDIGAFAAGHAPTRALRIDARHGELRLQLGELAGSVRGVVRDVDERELGGALVVLDAGSDDGCPLFATQSDARGAFSFASVKAGMRRLDVHAPGRAPWSARIELAHGAAEVVDVRLAHGVRVEGRLLDGAGAPIADALVWAAKRRWSTLPGPRHAVAARTDAHGAFALAGLEQGTIWLALERDGAVRERERLEAASGEVLCFERTLELGPRLQGRVVDVDGAPLAGLTLHATPAGELGARRARTDAEGRFVFADCVDEAHRVEAFEADACVWRGELEPSDEVHTLVLAPQSRPSARFVGRLIDADGSDLALSSIRLRTRDGAHGERVALEVAGPGPFRSAAVAPGPYRVQLIAVDGTARTFDGEHELAPHATYDLGTVRMHAPMPIDEPTLKESDR